MTRSDTCLCWECASRRNAARLLAPLAWIALGALLAVAVAEVREARRNREDWWYGC